MDNQLEQTRNIWVNAFFTGNFAVLAQYEHEQFKVVYEQEGRVESNFTRYERIAHAVKNGVWKPQQPQIEFEEFEFDRDLKHCKVLIGLHDQKQIQELWVNEGCWKIIELRFLKRKKIPQDE
ncbi:MAG: hypothetical protein ACN6NJ_08615 [Acinetobacter sp.]